MAKISFVPSPSISVIKSLLLKGILGGSSPEAATPNLMALSIRPSRSLSMRFLEPHQIYDSSTKKCDHIRNSIDTDQPFFRGQQTAAFVEWLR